MGPDPTEHGELAHVLAMIAATVLGDRTLEDDLERLARLVTETVPRCSGASVALLVHGAPQTVAASDRVAVEIDLAQHTSDEGPCLAALDGHVVRVAFLARDERFPRFAAGAADLRVHSVLSVPATDGGRVVGTLNVYSHEVDAFGTEAEVLGRVFGAEIGAIVASSRLFQAVERASAHLQEEHDDLVVVSVATRALVSLYEITAEQALGLIEGAADANAEDLIAAAHRILEQADGARGDGPPP